MQLRKIQLVSNSLLNWLLQGKDNSFNLPAHTKNMICQNIVESKSFYCDYEHKKVENISLEDFSDMLAGDLNPMGAFMSGKMKVKGDPSIALKLQSLFA